MFCNPEAQLAITTLIYNVFKLTLFSLRNAFETTNMSQKLLFVIMQTKYYDTA